MAYFQNDELEFVVDDYFDMAEWEDYPFGEENQQGMNTSGSDCEDDDTDMVIFGWSVILGLESMHFFFLWWWTTELGLNLQNKQKTDTSALEARNGKDIQGIPWERLTFTRDKCRETRLQHYKNYENLSCSREGIEKVGS